MLFSKPSTISTFNFPQVGFSGLIGLLLLSHWLNHSTLMLFLIGCLLGATLNYFQFGFRTCSQQLLSHSNTLGIRAVIIMLAISSLLFFSLLNMGSLAGQSFSGFVQPLSLSVVIGAFIFGVGMQLANGCTSGTLNKLGQLEPLSFTSLAFLILGGLLAAYHSDFWQNVPSLPAVSMLQTFGFGWGISLQFALLAALYFWTYQKEKRHSGRVIPLFSGAIWQIRQWHPWLKAVTFLALLNALLLLVSGQPWSIANGFPLWGIKISEFFQVPLDWNFWSYGITHYNRLSSPILQDKVSLTTLGVICGALLVSLLQPQRLKWSQQFSKKSYLYAMLGGFIMGYGAVIAFGCNIGAFFSGISSGSLHGWLWAISALAGSALGLWFTKRLGQSV